MLPDGDFMQVQLNGRPAAACRGGSSPRQPVARAGPLVYHSVMLFGRYGSFDGGIDLPDEKHATLRMPIAPCPPPERLLAPLASTASGAAEPTVRVGQSVTVGELLAASADGAAKVYAPLDGMVAGFTRALVAGGDGFQVTAAVELTDVSVPRGPAPVQQQWDWRAAGAEELAERLAAGGLPRHSRGMRTVTGFVRAARRAKVRTLIANVMEGQPYVTAAHRLLAEHGTAVIRGLAILGRCMGAAKLVLAFDARRTDDYRDLIGPARTYGIENVALPHKYPIDAEAMLVKVLCRRETPIGGSSLDVGAAVVDAATCLAVYRWVACDAPPTGRVVTVSGENAGRRGNFWVPFGMNCRELAHAEAEPVIHGGPMAGLRCPPAAVVSPATDAVLAPRAADAPAAGRCIRCGWCTDFCPVRLNV